MRRAHKMWNSPWGWVVWESTYLFKCLELTKEKSLMGLQFYFIHLANVAWEKASSVTGPFINYVDRILMFLTPFRWQVYNISLCTIVDIWLNPLPLACQRSLWMAPMSTMGIRLRFGTGSSCLITISFCPLALKIMKINYNLIFHMGLLCMYIHTGLPFIVYYINTVDSY